MHNRDLVLYKVISKATTNSKSIWYCSIACVNFEIKAQRAGFLYSQRKKCLKIVIIFVGSINCFSHFYSLREDQATTHGPGNVPTNDLVLLQVRSYLVPILHRRIRGKTFRN